VRAKAAKQTRARQARAPRDLRLERDLGALLHAASAGLATLGDRALKQLHVTSAQWKVLVVLARLGDLRGSRLVSVLKHDQAATSRLVMRMEAAGLLRRRVDSDDARATVISLTRKGRAAYQRCDARLRAVMGGLEDTLGSTEQRLLRMLLERFTDAIEEALRAALIDRRRAAR
jgi:DNA-binding MarR family transcriptional regulator